MLILTLLKINDDPRALKVPLTVALTVV